MAVCYRHTSRETGVSCSNCGRPICPDCMTPTPVGMRCPECSKQTTKVKRIATGGERPAVTTAIIAICALVWVAQIATSGPGGRESGVVYENGVLWGPLVGDGEVWRLLTGGFMHATQLPYGIMHVGFNMYILWFLGNMLEHSLGPVRFTALYFASLFAGAFGVLLLSPLTPTLGASGAVFGLMGAAFVMSRSRGIDPMASGIGPLILLNLAITFFPGLKISIGGHLGGLVGGALAALLMDRVTKLRRGLVLPVLACVLVAAVSIAGAIARAGAII